MHKRIMIPVFFLVLIAVSMVLFGPGTASAANAGEIDRNVDAALKTLYAKSPAAKALGEKAVGILVFPSIVKGGFLVGGQFGEGALRKKGKTVGYYNTVSVSYGLQVGVQKYGYALFFMSDSAMKWLDRSDGWELGSAPNIVIVDKGMSGGISTTSAQASTYAFFFGQKGLMGGLGLQGTKVTKIEK